MYSLSAVHMYDLYHIRLIRFFTNNEITFNGVISHFTFTLGTLLFLQKYSQHSSTHEKFMPNVVILFSGLQLQLDTEQEEKRLLQEQLQDAEVC